MVQAMHLARHVGARAVHGREGAVGVILRLVEHRGVGPGGAADDLGDHVRARSGRSRPAPFLLERHPAVHHPRQALLAVADDEQIDEGGQQFRVLAPGPPAMTSGWSSVRSLLCSGMPPRSSMVRMLV